MRKIFKEVHRNAVRSLLTKTLVTLQTVTVSVKYVSHPATFTVLVKPTAHIVLLLLICGPESVFFRGLTIWKPQKKVLRLWILFPAGGGAANIWVEELAPLRNYMSSSEIKWGRSRFLLCVVGTGFCYSRPRKPRSGQAPACFSLLKAWSCCVWRQKAAQAGLTLRHLTYLSDTTCVELWTVGVYGPA